MINEQLQTRLAELEEHFADIFKKDETGKLWELCKTCYMMGAHNTLDLLCAIPLDEAINELIEYTKSKLQ